MKKFFLAMLIVAVAHSAKALTVNASFFLDATAMQSLPYTFPPGWPCTTLKIVQFDKVWAVCEDDCSTLYVWSGSAPFPISAPNGSAININLTGPSTNWTALSGASKNPTCSNLIIVGVSFKDFNGAGVTHILQDNNYCASSLSIPGNEGAGYDCVHNLGPSPCLDMDCTNTTGILNISIYYCLTCGFGGVPGTEVWINQI
ncbi:MAG: hypothetical protein JST70_12050 [Bacteroidetes bacterium]|nr:hypothetical protein [Bacteroidota bacterium]